MKKCKICNKKGLFLKLNPEGVCNDCVRLNEINKKTIEAENKITQLNKNIIDLNKAIDEKRSEIDNLKENKDDIILAYKNEMLEKYETEIAKELKELESVTTKLSEKESELNDTEETIRKNEKSVDTLKSKIIKLKELHNAMRYSQEMESSLYADARKTYDEEIKPTVDIHLHYMDIAELRKKFNDNRNNIKQLLLEYENRYKTKTNRTIYEIMILALEAELQNILVDLKYGKLENGKNQVIAMTRKYLSIASDGNQNIVSTLTSFIGQIEALYLNAVEIEYEYYTKKEKIKEEQRTLREQMRQEAAERKLLAEQKAQVEKEEGKYKSEIESLKENILSADSEKKTLLENRIKELEEQLAKVQEKKEEIVNLQNGKAGYVYVISNLGSFGDDIFKIGMTRRLDPQERVDELGSASVPFPFDVHSFIFSNDAVMLEHNLHSALNNNRVNKINLRKEFFKVNIDQLEKMILDYDPTAEFKRTMLAEQFRQSLSAGDMNIVYDIEKELEEDLLSEEELMEK